jgi:LPXTG-motif cell wall-anchored protein
VIVSSCGLCVHGRTSGAWLAEDEETMKKAKEQPSVAGLLLLVAGMLLISMVVLTWAGSPSTGDNGKMLLGLAGAGLASMIAGAALSGAKRKKRV